LTERSATLENLSIDYLHKQKQGGNILLIVVDAAKYLHKAIIKNLFAQLTSKITEKTFFYWKMAIVHMSLS